MITSRYKNEKKICGFLAECICVGDDCISANPLRPLKGELAVKYFIDLFELVKSGLNSYTPGSPFRGRRGWASFFF